MLVSDHPHLFETGGENYHTDFTAWAYERGHENDPWRTTPDPTWMGSPALPVERPAYHHAYDDSRTWFRSEEDFPGPRTMRAAADWIRTSAPHHDRFFLMVDEFDPHEPFDTPEPYASLYNGDEPGADRAIWPPYLVDALAGGLLDPARARHLRNNYGSKLTMIDHWFGRLLRAIDDAGLAGTTGVVLCTDHGHYLGEHDLFGKPAAPVYSELGRIPLLVRWPGRPPRDVDALTTSVDLHATIADLFGAERRPPDPRDVAAAAHRGHGHVGARPRTVRLLGPPRRGHRRPEALPARAAATRTCRCRCGPTGGRPCRSTRCPSSGCRDRTTGPSCGPCRARRCRSSCSRSGPVTPSPTGPSGRRRRTRSCSTPRSTRARRRTGPAAATRRNSSTDSPRTLHAISAPDDLLARMGLA